MSPVAAVGACPELSLDLCTARLERLREGLAEMGATAALVHEPDVVRRLIGATSMHGWPAALIVTPGSAVAVLFATAELPSVATEQVVLKGISRDRPIDHARELHEAAGPWLRALRDQKGVAMDTHAAPVWMFRDLAESGVDDPLDSAALLIALRRRKDADELAIIEHNLRLCEAAYLAAAEVIAPGVSELEVYGAMGRAVEDAAGTSVTFGGDFMAGPGGGERGGPPSRRVIEEGEAYVLDFFPSQGGYWADMCRTFPVGRPSPALADALSAAVGALEVAEGLIAPGVPAAEVDSGMRAHLARWGAFGGDYFHLSGHGIGVRPHEAPWLVAGSEEVFEVGDVIAVEPGIYRDGLAGGVRMEDDYVVVEGGVRRLSSLPRLLGAGMEAA